MGGKVGAAAAAAAAAVGPDGTGSQEPKPGPSSRYKGVTLHRRSGRWESHIWAGAYTRPLFGST